MSSRRSSNCWARSASPLSKIFCHNHSYNKERYNRDHILDKVEIITMKILRNSIGAAVITTVILALVAFVFSGAFKTLAAEKTPLDTVSYLPIPAGAYNLDPAHTVIGFGVKHLEISIVEGRFKDFKGTINFDDKDVTKSSVEF